eukprot:scaffold19484_cov67-Phaeocystis_antarctica.AAC.1
MHPYAPSALATAGKWWTCALSYPTLASWFLKCALRSGRFSKFMKYSSASRDTLLLVGGTLLSQLPGTLVASTKASRGAGARTGDPSTGASDERRCSMAPIF